MTLFLRFKIKIQEMKRVLFSSVVVVSIMLASCGGGEESADQGQTEITTENVESTTSIAYAEEMFDFGSITEGEKVTHVFNFTNTGDADLVIVSAKGSCGCTVPEWPKEPIAPGAEGKISVVFNSEGKKGMQNKRVSIVANTEPATTAITLKGEVISPETAGEPVEATE
jgi:hypothetical protein